MTMEDQLRERSETSASHPAHPRESSWPGAQPPEVKAACPEITFLPRVTRHVTLNSASVGTGEPLWCLHRAADPRPIEGVQKDLSRTPIERPAGLSSCPPNRNETLLLHGFSGLRGPSYGLRGPSRPFEALRMVRCSLRYTLKAAPRAIRKQYVSEQLASCDQALDQLLSRPVRTLVVVTLVADGRLRA